jgi:hypothetical protein
MRSYVAAVVALVGLLLLEGCDRQQPRIDPDDQAVVAARDHAREDVDAEITAARSVLDEPREFGRIEANTCQLGENNWKIKDPFYSACELDVAVGLAYDGDFREQVDALDRLLLSRGWTDRMGVGRSLELWDGERRSVGKLPSALYFHEENKLWIIFGSTETPSDGWLHDVDCDLARGTDTRCTHTPIDAYYSDSTGTPWATAWENAGKPGPLVIVLHFATVYQQDLR